MPQPTPQIKTPPLPYDWYFDGCPKGSPISYRHTFPTKAERDKEMREYYEEAIYHKAITPITRFNIGNGWIVRDWKESAAGLFDKSLVEICEALPI